MMRVHLSKRLLSVASHVHETGVVADVGCDHGFTSIYLATEENIKHVIAMDIGEGPLSRAKEHMKEYHAETKVSIRQSDGLEKLEAGEADTILISGMGGILMCRILEKDMHVVKSTKELVLSPQSDIPMVRKCLHRIGFRIDEEDMVYDQGKYYVIIHAVPGSERYEDEVFYRYGKCLIMEKNPVFLEYIKLRKKQTEKIIGSMEEKKLSSEGEERLELLRQEGEQLEQILREV